MKIISFLLFFFRCCYYNIHYRQLWDDNSRQYIPLDFIHPSLELRTNTFPIDSGGSSSSTKTNELMAAIKFSGLLLYHRVLEKITQQPLLFLHCLSSTLHKQLKQGK